MCALVVNASPILTPAIQDYERNKRQDNYSIQYSKLNTHKHTHTDHGRTTRETDNDHTRRVGVAKRRHSNASTMHFLWQK